MNQSYLEKNELLHEIPPFPETVSFPISMVCNAACKFCYKTLFPQSISYSPKFLSYETIKNIIIPKIKGKVNKICLSSEYGDPLFNPEFDEIVSFIKKEGFFLYFFTNGFALDSHKINSIIYNEVDHILFSIDHGDKNKYEDTRVGLKYDVVIQNILNFMSLYFSKVKTNCNTKVSISAVIAEDDIHFQLKSLLDLCEKCGIKNLELHDLFSYDVSSFINKKSQKKIFSNELMKRMVNSRFKNDITIFLPSTNNSDKKICSELLKTLYLDINLHLKKCCIFPQMTTNVSLFESSLENLWNSYELNKFRSLFLGYPQKIPSFCNNCPMLK